MGMTRKKKKKKRKLDPKLRTIIPFPKLKRKRPVDSDPSTVSTSQSAAPTAEPTKKKSRKEKRITKSEKNDAKENKAFDSLVSQYKNKFTNNQQVLKKWFDT